MKRGDLYRVFKASSQDPRKSRVFVVVSRQTVIDSQFSTVVCAPIYSRHDALTTQVAVGIEEGLKHSSSIHCDELISIPKVKLTNYVGSLSPQKLKLLNHALKIALDLD
ncbi:MAG: type II toxin-antitoxin system PemK/MazF family toxin [Calditrichaeota bacterium]|nr:MAG: type II toxin-antitoxin system PemK/MazF family toxin [Calditrichota bacterium]